MELMNIGEFAAMTGLSARALRLYDEVGLFRPAWVDAETGYRQYDLEQAVQARLIGSLRQIGMPLERIGAVLGSSRSDATSSPTMAGEASAADRVATFWAQAEFEHAGRRALAGYLVDELRNGHAARYDVAVRSMPERQLLCLRRQAGAAEVVTAGRDFIVRRMREAGVPRMPGVEGSPFLIYHELVTPDSEGLIEWCRPVPPGFDEGLDEGLDKDKAFEVRTEPAHEEAYVHRLSAQDDHEMWPVMQSLAAWAVEHSRLPDGGVRLVYQSGGGGVSCDIAIPLRPRVPAAATRGGGVGRS